MELVTEPDLYSPSINDIGNYVDKIPSFTPLRMSNAQSASHRSLITAHFVGVLNVQRCNNIKHGLRCPCGSRKDKTYDTHSIFASHIKTKKHQSWLVDLNLNKTNFYLENINLTPFFIQCAHNGRIIE
jgi:hypothetical protein